MHRTDNKTDDQIKIKTLCEYLFFDQFQDTATFPRFEQCFQPLFNNINISMETVFKDICGEKKKYINYNRFAKAYLNHKNGNYSSSDTKIFFSTLLTNILKEENQYIGKTTENSYTFSTVKSCKKRECISLVEILSDKKGKIHGINIEYDRAFKTKMYPNKIEDELIISLEMSLGIVDEKPITEHKIGKFLGFKQGNYRDAVTHIFGTINQENGLITFLGFKCISGKTVFVGFPEGDGFLFGKFGNKFHNLKLQMTLDGITKLDPGFKTNPRKNFFLDGIFGKSLNFQNFEKEEIIKDEAQLAKLEDEVAIDKLITTPVVEDDHFFNTKLKDEISGNDYKEVVNQHPRNWILWAGSVAGKRRKMGQKKPMTLSDALKGFNEERTKRLKALSFFHSGKFGKRFSKDIPPFGGIPPHGISMPMSLTHGGMMGGPLSKIPPKGAALPGSQTDLSKGGASMPPFIPWLYKAKVFIPKPRPGMFSITGKNNKNNDSNKISKFKKKWNGKIDKKTPPFLFLNRHNYIGLKERLGKMIHEEISKKTEGNEQMKQILLNEIIPDPGGFLGRRFKFNALDMHSPKSFFRLQMRNLKGDINFFGAGKFSGNNLKLKKAEESKEKIKDEKNKNNETTVVYSDALQMLNDISDEKDEKNKNNEDNLFGFGNKNDQNKKYNNPYNSGYMLRKYYSSNIYNVPKGIPPIGSNINQRVLPNPQQKQEYNNNNKNEYQRQFSHDNFTTNNLSQQQQDQDQPKSQEEIINSEKYKEAQEKWQAFRKGLDKINGVYLLQTIGGIIKSMKILENEKNGKNEIPLPEKVKLYKIIEENEAIVDFLSQEPTISSQKECECENEQMEIEGDDEEDNILIPDEHPEDFTSLDELEDKLNDIKKLLENKKLKEEDRKKIEKLHNLYLQQKNILIENETKSAKTEVIRQNNININKYIQEEQEKRKKAQEEEEKKIEKMQKEEEESKKSKKIKIQSILNQKVSTKIYRDQKMPTGDEPWIDDIFPPEKKSLCPFDSNGWVLPRDVWDSDVDGWEEFKWCRVEEIYDSKDYTVFAGGSTMDDIQQGNIGDCYFLSVLGSLCAFPDFFNKLFHIKEITKEHVYGVYIYINGKWELVLVDDYLPYQGNDFKQFAFSFSSENEIWVALLEKAWAKVNGCYAKIGCGGLPNEVFDVLTEAFTEQKSVNKNNKEEIWNKCEDAVQKGYVMTAGTSGDVTNLDIEEVGLSPAHAYSFLNVYKVKTDNGIERVVKLRNPWGNGEYNGAWSDSSKKWTESTKKQCGYKDNNDDGVFYMSYDDFIKYYVTMGFAKLEHGYKTTVCKIGKAKATKCQILKLVVNKENKKSYIQLYQKNPRIILRDGTYQSTVLSFIMLVDENFKYIKSISSREMHLGLEEDLKVGTYFVLCDVNYRYVNEKGKNHGYNVTCYSKNPILIENVTEKIDGAKALEVAMYYYCKNKIGNPTKDKSGMEIYISKNYNSDLPFMIACFVNPTSLNYKVRLEVNGKGDKSYCIYNDSIATENDSSVIKEVKSGSACTFSVLKYTLSSMFSLCYTILPSDDERTNENTNPVFNEEGEQIDENGFLFQYILEVDNGTGYTIGLENSSPYKIKLKLILEGLMDVDPEYKGQVNPVFECLPKSKKVFNLKVIPDADILAFEFTYA